MHNFNVVAKLGSPSIASKTGVNEGDNSHTMVITGIETIGGQQCSCCNNAFIQCKNSYRDDPNQAGIIHN